MTMQVKEKVAAVNKVMTLFVFMILALQTHAQVSNNAPQKPSITYTTINNKPFRDAWGLNDEESKTYNDYMQTTGKFFYTHLDPLMVLGFIEENPAKRAALAERHLIKSRQRIIQERTFVEEIGDAQKRLYAGEKAFNFARLPGYDAHKEKLAALRSSVSTARANKTGPAVPVNTTVAKFNWNDNKSIVSIDYLIPAECKECINTVKQMLDTPETVIINLYAKDGDINYLEQVIQSVANEIEPARVISAKRYDSIVFAGIANPSKPVVRRDGVVVARL